MWWSASGNSSFVCLFVCLFLCESESEGEMIIARVLVLVNVQFEKVKMNYEVVLSEGMSVDSEGGIGRSMVWKRIRRRRMNT